VSKERMFVVMLAFYDIKDQRLVPLHFAAASLALRWMSHQSIEALVCIFVNEMN